jgi:uncharacterized protein YhaN
MYITGLHIDGFGIYHDQGLQGLPLGLVLLVGDNESGKTTLMEFLRTLLFGFPRKSKKPVNEYEPLRGGNHGGRLATVMQDGRQFTISRPGRAPANLTPAGGATIQAEPGLQLLGGLDRDTFKHVFAVGLDELQGLEVLSQEGVRGRLLAAGAGLGSASVPEVMKGLDKELANLLAQRGQKQINLLMKQLREIETGIKALQGQAAAYAAGHRQREHLEAQIEADRHEAERLRRQLGRLDRLEQARVPWANRNLAREKALEVEFARNFPVNGIGRLESFDKELEKVRQDRKEQAGEVTRLQELLERLRLDEALLAQQEAIEALASEREKLATDLDNYPVVKSDLEQVQAEFLRKLRELGPAWDAARLTAVDTSVQVRQRVAEFGRRLDAAERRVEAARAQERAMLEAVTDAQKQTEIAAQHLQDLPTPPIVDNQELARHQETLRQLRAWLHQRDVLAEKLASRVSALDEVSARAAGLEGQLANPAATLPWWLCLPWLVVGLGLGGWFLFQRAYLLGGVVPGAGLALAGLFFWLHHWQTQVEARRRAILGQELQQVEESRAGILEAITDLRRHLEAADTEIALAAQIMDREPPGDVLGLEEIAGELEEAAARLREWQARIQEERQAADQLATAGERLRKAKTEAEQATGELKRLEAEWAEWLSTRGFSEPVRPAGFEAVLQAVENARGAAGLLESHGRRLQLLSAYLASAKERIGRVLTACGLQPEEVEPGVADLDALRRALSKNLEAAQQKRDLTRQLTAAARNLDSLAGQGQELERERQDLFQQAGAADAEDFWQRGQAHQQWRDLVHQIETEETALRRIAGTREAQLALEEELSRTDPLELEMEKTRLTGQSQNLEQAISQADQEIGDLKGRLKSMEQDRQLGELLLQQRTVQAQLTEATRRWATLAVCRHLLDQARGVYERERQPQVIKEADRFLNIMAHGRYRILAAVGEDGVHLEDRSLARKDEVTWSAGLADQVYLAIRLGLAREFGRHSEPLPVILDDVLVKFDPSRRANAARVILDFARHQQVLLFSCHPEFVEIIETVRQDPRYQETAVATLVITDGVINRVSAGPALALTSPQ